MYAITVLREVWIVEVVVLNALVRLLSEGTWTSNGG